MEKVGLPEGIAEPARGDEQRGKCCWRRSGARAASHALNCACAAVGGCAWPAKVGVLWSGSTRGLLGELRAMGRVEVLSCHGWRGHGQGEGGNKHGGKA